MCTENSPVFGLDWRGSFAVQIGTVSSKFNSQFRQETMPKDSLIVPSYFDESLILPSSQRLFSLNQVSPVAEKVLGFDVSRGQHTEDTMRLTYFFLQNLSKTQPDLFNQFISDYTSNGTFTSDEVIHHCVEYMRLHDSATLAFQGAMHEKVKIGEKGYDENDALLNAFKNTREYKPITELLFDKATLAHHKSSGINRDLLKKIAQDAISGTSPLGSMLKKGYTHPPIDWLAYTARDFHTLTQLFGIEELAPFSKKIEGILAGLFQVSTSLEKGTPLSLPHYKTQTKIIETYVPKKIVKLDIDQGVPTLVYDGQSIAQIYLMHMVLRNFFSGSPWIKGTYSLIFKEFNRQKNNDDELLRKLLTQSEETLLKRDLADALPIQGLNNKRLTNPTLIPQQVKGWKYSTTNEMGALIEKFKFKDIGKTIVEIDGKTANFEQAYPELIELKDNAKDNPQIYLTQTHP